MIQPQHGRQSQKPKKAKWLPITKEDEATFQILDEQLASHPGLIHARIALAWMLHVTPNTDGQLVLGQCIKAPPLWQKLAGIDFVIALNREFWLEADLGQREFLMDHELCHAARSIDSETGDQNYDDQGDLLWRTKKHDLEEFFGPVSRHGLRMSNLHRFYQVAHRAQLTLPYSVTGADLETGARTRSAEKAIEDLDTSDLEPDEEGGEDE